VARVTCVSVTYGPTPEIGRMPASLRRNTLNDGDVRDVEVCVVTQPSAEGRASLSGHEWVREIRLDENVGFGPANNLAVGACDSEFVAFVNPDLELTPGWLSPLLDALHDPAVAVAAPVLLDGDGRVDEAGSVVCRNAETYAMGSSSWPGGRDESVFTRDVPYASAACWVMRRTVFLELGGFDAAYAPAYFEDPDLCFTAFSRGLVTRLVVDRPVVHHHSIAGEFRLEIARRSQSVFKDKWADVQAELRAFLTRQTGASYADEARFWRRTLGELQSKKLVFAGTVGRDGKPSLREAAQSTSLYGLDADGKPALLFRADANGTLTRANEPALLSPLLRPSATVTEAAQAAGIPAGLVPPEGGWEAILQGRDL